MTVTSKLSRHLYSLATRRARSGKVVTSDDAQRILDRWRYKGNRSLIGGVLRSRFQIAGYTRSKIPSNKGRIIQTWTV